MTRLRGVLKFSTFVLLCLTGTVHYASAQQFLDDQATDPPAHVAFVDGAATLERDGQPDASPLNMPLLAGDRVRTQGGRVEILFGDGSILHLDANAVVDFQSDELVRLLNGRVRLAIPGARRSVSYRIDAPWASAQVTVPGEYRVSIVRGDAVELAVIRGAAELVNEQGRTPLGTGERAVATADVAPSYAYVYNSASWDAFDQWSEARRDERLGVSTQYLPEDVRPYAASFDRYGAWQYEASYGYVWYPRVAVGWRPYYNGRWATLRPYGWTWIGADPWAWPTHHYGRWGFSAGLWFWIPGRNWGPAWVSWAYAPGYVSWCPLGWNNRPVFQVHMSHYSGGYGPWRAWTAAPQHHFTRGHVNVRSVGRFDLDARAQAAFSQGTRGPAFGGYAVPRATTPIHAAGTGRPSVSSPLYTNLDARDSRVGRAPSRTMVSPPSALPRDPGSGVAPGASMNATRQPATRNAGAAPAARPSAGTPAPAQRYAPPDQERSGYGRIERATPRTAVPRDDRSYGATPSTIRPYGRDMGIGGGAVAGRSPEPDRPAYGRIAPEPYGGGPAGGSGVGRAMPRDRGDAPAYRSSPRGPESAPPRGIAPAQPRASSPAASGPSRAPSADRPSPPPSSTPGHVRSPGNSAPTGQARPRGGGRGGH